MLKQRKTYITAACLAVATLAGGAAVSQVSHTAQENRFPTGNIQATLEMQERFPELF